MLESPKRVSLWIKLLAVLFLLVVSFISLNYLRQQSYQTQLILSAPQNVFTYWHWPLEGWRFQKADLKALRRPEIVLNDLEGLIMPKFWNLLMQCPSGSNLILKGANGTIAGPENGVHIIRELFTELSEVKNKFHAYVCQSTRLTLLNSQLQLIMNGKTHAVRIQRFSAQKTESPVIELDGSVEGQPPFGLTLTYKPQADIVVFTTDLWQQSHFDGQVEAFSKAQSAYLSGEAHGSAVAMTFGDPQKQTASLKAVFSLSADISGVFEDLAARLMLAETLRIDGAVDARAGVFTPFNLSAEVLREAGQIPALAQLGTLIEGKALPKPFYVPETPFELLRFVIHKEGRLINLSRIVMKHELYLAAGEGSLDPETGALSIKGSLVLSDDLSRDLIKNVPRLEMLSSEGGRLAFPLTISGNLRAPKIHADMKEITEYMIAAYRNELVRRGNSRIVAVQQ